jgi:hypothetical protein
MLTVEKALASNQRKDRQQKLNNKNPWFETLTYFEKFTFVQKFVK